MLGVKNTRTCPKKNGPGAAYDNVFERKAHHRMPNEKLGKLTKFGDPRSANVQHTKNH